MIALRIGQEPVSAVHLGADLLWEWQLPMAFTSLQGAAFEPARLDLLSQVAAGTTPANAAGQPVGLVRDLSGGERHAAQSVSPARPTLGRHPRTGRRNLLTWTEAMTTAPWSTFGSAPITPSGTLGGVPAFGVADTITGNYAGLAQSLSMTDPGTYTAQLRVAKTSSAVTLASFRIGIRDAGNVLRYSGMSVNPNTGAANIGAGGWTYSRASAVAKDRGDYWLMVVIFNLVSGDRIEALDIFPAHFDLAGSGGAAHVASQTFAAPQLEAGASDTPYQRVATQYDVTEQGQPDVWYLYTDAADDALTVTVPAGGWSNATIALATDSGISFLTGQTIPAGVWTLPLPRPSKCYGFVVLNGPLTAAETSLLTRWLNTKRGS